MQALDRARPQLVFAALLAALAACGDGTVDATTDTTPGCGNSRVDEGEECDDGNALNGDGCDGCRFTCVAGDLQRGNKLCSDGNPCTGVELCGSDHRCQSGTSLDEGAACADGKVCVQRNCVAPSCGDGQVQTGEECDDGNAAPGDGCEPVTCKLSCVATDAARNCASADPCVNPGTCNASHVCVPGGAKANGASCGSGQICLAGACQQSSCGDGFVDAARGEQCEDGNFSPGDGCEADCTYSCESAADCTAPVCNSASCVDVLSGAGKVGQRCQLAPAHEGQSPPGCAAPGTCVGGLCHAPGQTCGDGVVEGTEECDFGGANAAGSGCEATCRFSCSKQPDSCADSNVCNGVEACATVTVDGRTGQKCAPGTPAEPGTACGSGLICRGSPIACVASVCGDGYVDGARGESCEPPGTGTCDASCHTVACGNNALETGEQCDDADGTPGNLDGCDTACRYEVFLRLTSLQVASAAAPSGCTPTTNILGTQVLSSTARSTLNSELSNSVSDGSTNVLVQLLGLDDLTGTADASLELGFVPAALDPAKGAWPGGAPIDWWFLASQAALDGAGLPATRIAASVAARQVQAGPADVVMNLGADLDNLMMRSTRIFATVDNPPAPNTPAGPPALLAPSVQVFQSVSANGTGKGLCGNVTVESLAKTPIPEAFTTACDPTCGNSRKYTYCGAGQPVGPGCNSLLDAIVGGCQTRIFICLPVVQPTQPDVSGAGYAGTLAVDGPLNKVPAAQTTGSTRAYSAFFTFTANRAHATGTTQ